MARPLVTEEMWRRISDYLPEQKPSAKRGRPPVSDRAVVTGILFVLRTGIAWGDLPPELGCGCGMTCLRRLRFWQRTGAWEQIRQILGRDFGLTGLNWTRFEPGRSHGNSMAGPHGRSERKPGGLHRRARLNGRVMVSTVMSRLKGFKTGGGSAGEAWQS